MLLGARGGERSVDRVHAHAIDLLDVPAIRGETCANVLGERHVRGRGQRDLVRIVEDNETTEMQLARERGGFGRDALHQVAIARDHVRAMVDDVMVRPVEGRGEPTLRHGHADCIGESLSQRSGRDLDTRRHAALGMTRRSTAPPPKVLEVIEGEAIPAHEEKAVEQRAAMARREDEAVAVAPVGRRCIVAQVSRPEHVGHCRRTHGQPRMSRLCLLDGVDAERAQGVNAQGLDRGAGRCHWPLPPRARM